MRHFYWKACFLEDMGLEGDYDMIVTSSCGRGIDRAAYDPLHFLIR